MVFGSMVTSIIKSKIIATFIDRREVGKSLLFSFIFYMLPFMAFYICHFSGVIEGIAYVIIIAVGFFPVDGENALIFNRIQQCYFSRYSQNHYGQKIQSQIPRLNYIFQAVGSLWSLMYLSDKV